jgi:hypothetical protein
MKNLTERYLDAADHFRTVFVRRGRTPDAAAAADEITRDIYADRIIPGSRLAGVSFFTYDGGPDGDDLTPGAGVILPDGRFLFTEPFGYLIPSPSVVAAAAAYFTHDRPAGPDPALTRSRSRPARGIPSRSGGSSSRRHRRFAGSGPGPVDQKKISGTGVDNPPPRGKMTLPGPTDGPGRHRTGNRQ